MGVPRPAVRSGTSPQRALQEFVEERERVGAFAAQAIKPAKS